MTRCCVVKPNKLFRMVHNKAPEWNNKASTNVLIGIFLTIYTFVEENQINTFVENIVSEIIQSCIIHWILAVVFLLLSLSLSINIPSGGWLLNIISIIQYHWELFHNLSSEHGSNFTTSRNYWSKKVPGKWRSWQRRYKHLFNSTVNSQIYTGDFLFNFIWPITCKENWFWVLPWKLGSWSCSTKKLRIMQCQIINI